jgi:hypothetical protein
MRFYPQGSLGEAYNPLNSGGGLFSWFRDERRPIKELKKISRTFPLTHDILSIAYKNLDYCKHEKFPLKELCEEVWKRLVRWLVDEGHAKEESFVSTSPPGKVLFRPDLAALRMPRVKVLALLRDSFETPKSPSETPVNPVPPVDPPDALPPVADGDAGGLPAKPPAAPALAGDGSTPRQGMRETDIRSSSPEPPSPNDPPLELGSGPHEKARIWNGNAWVDSKLTGPRFRVLKRLLEAYRTEARTIGINELRSVAPGAYDVVRKMRTHHLLKLILTEKGSYGLVIPKQPTE